MVSEQLPSVQSRAEGRIQVVARMCKLVASTLAQKGREIEMRYTELRALVDDPARRRAIPSVELTTALLERAQAFQPQLGAFYSFRRDEALVDAERVDARRQEGTPTPLDGMPIGIKDNIDVAGLPTTAGSAAFKTNIPVRDAEVVRRLRAAGAVVIGKTALHELAFGSTCDSAWFGRTSNPWDLERLPGTSSCGSGVALSVDLCIGALGSDTGGSIRAPASFQSVCGLRPTTGSVSTRGLVSLSWNLDTIGPMARNVRDVADLYAVMRGVDPEDPHSRSVPAAVPVLDPTAKRTTHLRIGIPRLFFYEQLDSDVSEVIEAALRVLAGLGATMHEVALSDAANVRPAALRVMRSDAWAAHRDLVERSPELLSSDIRDNLLAAKDETAGDYSRSLEELSRWSARIDAVFDSVDLLALPTTPCVAPLISDVEAWKDFRMGRCTLPWSAAGTPALSIPAGLTRTGLPVGLQLVARRWHEGTLFRVGHAFQSVTDWHHRRPLHATR